MKMCVLMNAQEAKQLQEFNSQQRTDLERQHFVETRQLHKNLKSETKTRTLQFKKSRRISGNVALSSEQELEQMKEVCASSSETTSKCECFRPVYIFRHRINLKVVICSL